MLNEKTSLFEKIIKLEFFLVGLFIILVIVAIASYNTLQTIEAQTKQGVGNSIQTVLKITQNALHAWFDERKEDIISATSDPDLLQLTRQFLKLESSKQSLLGSSELAAIRLHLQSEVNRHKGVFFGFFIISPDHINLASMRDSNIGTINLMSGREGSLSRVFQGETLISLPMESDVPLPDINGKLTPGLPTMFAVTPIYDESKKIIAALSFRIDPASAFTKTLQLGRMGATGETYAFDKSGKLISESHFDEQLRQIGLLSKGQRGILSVEIRDPQVNLLKGFHSDIPRARQPLTHMASEAIAGRAGVNLEGYNDYRGVPVVGAWVWDKKLGFGIATEINRDEAYAPFVQTQKAFLSLLIFTSVIFSIFSVGIIFGKKRILEALEERVIERTRKLARANEDLKTFTYIVSHDLRAPLINVKGFAHELKAQMEIIRSSVSDLLPSLDEEKKRQVELALSDKIPLSFRFIDKAADRMDALIGAILKLSRLGQRELVVQAINTNNLVNRILDTFSHQIKEKGILVTVHPLPNMQSDPVAMEQIFGNILTNAINYLDPDRPGEIEVSGETRKRQGKLIFHIKDNGRGIAEEEMHKVFKIFRRAGKETVSGEGMGMAYVKTLVQRYAGDITCQSKLGEGTTFSFSISTNR